MLSVGLDYAEALLQGTKKQREAGLELFAWVLIGHL